jgi:peptide/nickel transport system ATP-binding protein
MTLDVEDLKVYFYTRNGAVRAVDGISFRVKEGETLGLVGESGCGKTTTGMAIMNMIPRPGRITGGTISIDGREISSLDENTMRKEVRWKKVSMVFQGAMNCLTPTYTIGKQMVETIVYHTKMEEDEALEIVKRYLAHVGLKEDVVRRYPHELSGGMKQRVVIATALLLEPRLVICDEPTTALDVVVQAQIINLLKRLKKELHLSYIFITHDLSIEAEVADRLAVMYAGKIVELGANEQIYGREPLHPYTQKLLASTPRLREKVSELDFIPGVPPDLLNPPTGCRFHPRCPYAFDRCREEEPELREVEDGHMVACWRSYDS